MTLDPVTVLATKTPETTTEALAGTSAVRQETINQLTPSRASQVLFGIPGVWVQERADDPGTAVNIRGLQDFGRVAVTVDGARQNFQRTGHNANGVFYVEPELLSGADVVRGPVANIYGSGAIGGIVSYSTKDPNDILRPGEQWAMQAHGEGGSNKWQGLGSTFLAFRGGPNAEFLVGGTDRNKTSYKDANGTDIPNSGYNVWTGIAKAVVRPADGHQIKFGYIHYDSGYVTGQPNPPTFTTNVYDAKIRNEIATLRWTYSRPDDRLWNFDNNVYWTRTDTGLTKLMGAAPGFPTSGVGNIGDVQNFRIDTYGFDVNNTSRFDAGPVRYALTVGADGFRDKVNDNGFLTVFTPSGERTVSGGFAQLKSNYSTWLEVIGALRYDNYSLNGGGFSTNGDHVSPKITVGITPIAGVTPYATYAEGYRAPAVTETLIAGLHPVFFAPFVFTPNPGLMPETGKTKEVGLNLRFDNILQAKDSFRAKAAVFRNDVSNYIDQVPLTTGQAGQGGQVCTTAAFLPFGPPPGVPFDPDCIQYQNIAAARLQGAEFESMYDAGMWFLGLSGSHVRGRNQTTGAPLASVAPDWLATTVGTRLFDHKLTVAVRWLAVAAKPLSEIPTTTSGSPVFPPTDSYNVVNLYVDYTPITDIKTYVSVENLFNKEYSRYMTVYPNPVTNAAPVAFPQPGVTVKVGLQVRFSDHFFKKG